MADRDLLGGNNSNGNNAIVYLADIVLGMTKSFDEFRAVLKEVSNNNNAAKSTGLTKEELQSALKNITKDLHLDKISKELERTNKSNKESPSDEYINKIRKKFDEESKLIDEEKKARRSVIEQQSKLNKEYNDIINRRNDIDKKSIELLSKSAQKNKALIDSVRGFFSKDALKQTRISALRESAENKEQIAFLKIQQEFAEVEQKTLEDKFDAFDKAIKQFEDAIANAEKNGDEAAKEEAERGKKKAILEKKKAELDLEQHHMMQESYQKQIEAIEENEKQNKKYLKQLEKQMSWQKQLGNKIADIISDTLTAAAQRQTELLSDAAKSAFSTIEKSQESIGKILKMSSGAYSDFVEEVQSIADAEGLAISSSQVLELASNMAEQGVVNESLMQALAVSQAKVSETGSTIKLSEDTINTLQQSFFRYKREENLTDTEAAQRVEEAFNQMIAGERAIVEQFGSATALANGGMEELMNRAMQMVRTGDLAVEDVGEFIANYGGVMQAFTQSTGLDASTIIQDIDSILNNTESELSSQLIGFLQKLGMSREQFIESYSENPAETFKKLVDYNVDLFDNLDATSQLYKMQGYGSSATAMDMRAITNNSEALKEAMEKQGVSSEKIVEINTKLDNDLKTGKYLSATTKQERYYESMMDGTALIFQKIPDGEWLMNQTFEKGKSLINMGVELLAGAIGGLFGVGASGVLGKASTLFGKKGKANTGTNTLPTGAEETTLGGASTAPTKGKFAELNAKTLTSLAGVGMSGYGLVKGFSEDGVESALTDSTFIKGLGVQIGGAIGGPIGGIVGSVIADKAIPNISNKIENFLAGSEDRETAIQKMQKEAAESLSKSAGKLSESAVAQLEAYDKTRKEAESYSSSEKSKWMKENIEGLKKAGLVDKDVDISKLSASDTESMFNRTFDTYMTQLETGAVQDISKADIGAKMSSALASGGVAHDGKVYYDSSDIEKALKAGDINALEAGQIAKKLGNRQENITSVTLTKLAESGGLLPFLSKIDEATANGETTAYDAIQSFATEMGWSDGMARELIDVYSEIKQNRKKWKAMDELFQERYAEAYEQSATKNPLDIRIKYKELYEQSDDDLFDKLVFDPYIGLTAGNMFMKKNSVGANEIPHIYTDDGKYRHIPQAKIGLDYVPFDNYLTLLHQGEKVLNASEAEEYRTNVTSSFTSITDTLVAQTDRLENVLKQILISVNNISSGRNGATSLSKNIVNMVGDITSM